jgi:hypothetical protein
MTVEDPRQALREQINRTRARIAESRLAIMRSKERINDSLQAAAQAASGFELPAEVHTDEQLLVAAERGDAEVEQREIDREVRLTRRASHAPPPFAFER